MSSLTLTNTTSPAASVYQTLRELSADTDIDVTDAAEEEREGAPAPEFTFVPSPAPKERFEMLFPLRGGTCERALYRVVGSNPRKRLALDRGNAEQLHKRAKVSGISAAADRDAMRAWKRLLRVDLARQSEVLQHEQAQALEEQRCLEQEAFAQAQRAMEQAALEKAFTEKQRELEETMAYHERQSEAQLTSFRDDMAKALMEQGQGYEARMAEGQRKFAALMEEKEACVAQMTEGERRFATLLGEKGECDARRAESEQRAAVLVEEKAMLGARVAEVEGRVATLAEEKGWMDARLAEQERKVAALEEEKREGEACVAEGERRIATLGQEKEEVLVRLTEGERQYLALLGEKGQYEARLTEGERQCQRLMAEKEQVEAQLAGGVGHAEFALASEQRLSRQMAAQVATLQQHGQKLERDLTRATHGWDAAQDEAMELKNEVFKLEGLLAQSERAQEKLRARFRSAFEQKLAACSRGEPSDPNAELPDHDQDADGDAAQANNPAYWRSQTEILQQEVKQLSHRADVAEAKLYDAETQLDGLQSLFQATDERLAAYQIEVGELPSVLRAGELHRDTDSMLASFGAVTLSKDDGDADADK